MAVLVRYHNRALMSYHLTTYSPWEGYRVAFNGTEGRLEYEVHEESYVSGYTRPNAEEIRAAQRALVNEPASITIHPLWGAPVREDVATGQADRGGDTRMLAHIFAGGQDDPLGRAANHVAGAMSILTGIAANKSFATGLPVQVSSLVRF